MRKAKHISSVVLNPPWRYMEGRQRDNEGTGEWKGRRRGKGEGILDGRIRHVMHFIGKKENGGMGRSRKEETVEG